MAVRPYWKGYLKLSLVTCPVQMMPATSDNEKVRFHTLNRETQNRVVSHYVDSVTGTEVKEEDDRQPLITGMALPGASLGATLGIGQSPETFFGDDRPEERRRPYRSRAPQGCNFCPRWPIATSVRFMQTHGRVELTPALLSVLGH